MCYTLYRIWFLEKVTAAWTLVATCLIITGLFWFFYLQCLRYHAEQGRHVIHQFSPSTDSVSTSLVPSNETLPGGATLSSTVDQFTQVLLGARWWLAVVLLLSVFHLTHPTVTGETLCRDKQISHYFLWQVVYMENSV